MNRDAADFWTRALQAIRTVSRTASSDPDAAVSRAYYAAFCAVSALFALEEKTFSRHSALEAAVHRDLVKANRWPTDLGEDYAFLLRLRITGDYGGDLHVAEEERRPPSRRHIVFYAPPRPRGRNCLRRWMIQQQDDS